VFVEQKNSFVIEINMIYMFSVDCCNIPTGIDDIQNGETHGRMKLIEYTPSCWKILSSKVWINFSLIFLFNMYIHVTYQWFILAYVLRNIRIIFAQDAWFQKLHPNGRIEIYVFWVFPSMIDTSTSNFFSSWYKW
jgi:hypothetical protein